MTFGLAANAVEAIATATAQVKNAARARQESNIERISYLPHPTKAAGHRFEAIPLDRAPRRSLQERHGLSGALEHLARSCQIFPERASSCCGERLRRHGSANFCS